MDAPANIVEITEANAQQLLKLRVDNGCPKLCAELVQQIAVDLLKLRPAFAMAARRNAGALSSGANQLGIA